MGKLTTIKTFGMGLPLSLVKNMLEDSMNTFHGCVFFFGHVHVRSYDFGGVESFENAE